MATPVPLPRTVGEVFDAVVATDPGRELLVTRRGRWSYTEFDRLANRAARALSSLGVQPGDRVAGALPNDVDVVAAFHGTMRLGAVWVGVNRALAPPEKQYLLDDSGTSLLLCDDATAEQLPAQPTARVVVVGDNGAGDEWNDAVNAQTDDRLDVDIDPYAPAGIAYTSGTTGYPKGAVHSQYNLLLPGAALVASRGYGPELRKGDSLPLTILNMQVLTSLLVAQAGGTSVIMDRIDAGGVAEWIRVERVTLWNGPPAVLFSLATMDEVAVEELASLEELWVGGADCPGAIREAFERKFGIPVTHTYGLSEAPTVVTIEDRDGPHVDGAAGLALPHLHVTVVDGEVCVGPTSSGPWAGAYRTMLGYWQRDEATDEALAGGILHTGDLGELDADGYLHLRDRKSLVIIRGGANVYPAEVERVVHDVDGVAACAVMGVRDERLGERVVAAVEVVPGAAVSERQLTAHCLANLAKYKVPERWVFVETFPRNSMGKIQRRELAPLFE
jgi:acyl-CoA synthetase (AMP-forming)/AMP-acid ligase II